MVNITLYDSQYSPNHKGFPLFAERVERIDCLDWMFEVFTIRRVSVNIIRGDEYFATYGSILRAHSKKYVECLHSISNMGLVRATLANIFNPHIQWYTRVSPGSYFAAVNAAGTVCRAVNDVIAGDTTRAFCSVRPPGHHAGYERGEGFCLLNNVAIGALHALSLREDMKVVVVDFDRHHGNGTEEILSKCEPGNLLFFSSYQEGCKYVRGEAPHNSVRVPIPAGSDFSAIRKLYEENVLPRMLEFKPDLILVSAGFDMHPSDPLTNLCVTAKDYYELTRMLVDSANKTCGGRIVSVLEGGYNLTALQDCVYEHVTALGEP